MTVSRRKFVALVGGGVIVGASSAAGFALTRRPKSALAPSRRAGRYEDPRMRALSYAVLAPTPHNQQPWKVDLSTPDQAVLFADPDRLLPHTDPFSRQITIGLGCFLEIMQLAALEDGLGVAFDLFPEGSNPTALDHRPVAIFRFFPTTAPRDPLFAQVPHRRTLKEPYDTSRPVPKEALARIAQAAMHGSEVGFTNDVDLFRIGHREVDANPDGIDFSGPMFEMLRLSGLFSRETSMDRDSVSYKSAEDMVVGNVMTGMAHLWRVTQGNSRDEQLRAGQDWVRINLAATAEGIGLQPLSQGLQEYPEMANIYTVLHEALAPAGGTVQMWCRLGYGPDVSKSPRWPIESKLLNA